MRKLAPCLVIALLASSCSSPAKPAGGGDTAGPKADEPPAPRTESDAEKLVDNLAALRFDQLGHPVIRWDAIPPVRASRARPHELLVVLVEYSDLRFERFRRDPNQGTKLAAHYQEQLFDESYRRKDTLSHYYLEQSDGAYHVTGQVLPPVRLSKNRRAYGSPNRPVGGDWRSDTDPEAMVAEALKLAAAANPGLDWASFDRWDPTDHDGDGALDEADGYLDHFVLVFAGGGQSSCQLLTRIGDVLTANVDNKALAQLDRKQRSCADRMWPHRGSVTYNEGKGPRPDNTRGGVPVSDDLWVYDYNMQSEYTAAATFIHEFGHSIGLPDVYSRTSNNSTGAWEVMSATADPSPQSLSAWSRMQLGWLNPKVVRPPGFGGKASGQIHLATLGDRGDETSANAERAVMVILPPVEKVIALTALPEGSGSAALYGGQGNDMNRTMTRSIDLSGVEGAELSFDAWWEIEGGWDFAYVEVKEADGWKRILPVDRKHMPAKHGHDGKTTTPGFTGLSGDLDGDGKNESAPGCDPKKEVKSGEDRAGAEDNPCLDPSWVRPAFSLDPWAGKSIEVRIRYYTDGAAVMRGILIDNVAIRAADQVLASTDFESGGGDWKLDGFSPSPGRHELLVPHYYLLEYRDPHGASDYDKALAESSWSFYHDPQGDRMIAIEVRKRPGVLVWYFNGSYAWSENDPAINGPGKGYLLAVDSRPHELALPGLEGLLLGGGDGGDPQSHYDVKSPEAQSALEASYARTVCFVRSKAYLPRGVRCRRPALVSGLTIEGKKPMYSYEIINEYLPGSRDKLRKVSELVDIRERKGERTYRMRDRSLRHYHTYDAPFSFETFERGVVVYEIKDGELSEIEARRYPAVSSFDDQAEARWLNPKLPFGGVQSPRAGFSMEVVEPGAGAPDNAAAAVRFSWKR
jgi:M6 family metalloprotease-like protein